MKSSTRILSMVLLTAIYCFAIGVVTNRFAYSEFFSYSQSAQEQTVSDLSLKIFCHASQQSEKVESNTSIPAPNFNNQSAGLWPVANIVEQLFEARLSEYTSFSRKLQVNSRKADIIFPFHYFW